MEPLSLNPLAHSSKAVLLAPFSHFGNGLRWTNNRHPRRLLTQNHPPRRIVANSAFTASLQQTPKEYLTLHSYPNWSEFASRVSGEWDGFGAEFSSRGEPIQLPDNVVPEAFKEWEVQVFDWQTQCPTLAESPSPSFVYKLIKLLPTVGCEADAATRHSTEEKTLQNSSIFAYDQTGNYVAVWPLPAKSGAGTLEIEHCLRHPDNQEVRIRIIQRIKNDEKDFGLRVEKIEVFSEQWYGPYRNGEQLGGCSIRESGFAATAAIEESRVLGTWESVAVGANFSDSDQNAVKELGEERREKRIRVCEGLVALPKQLWSSTGKKDDDDGRWVEVGWMVDHGHAVTSRCVFSEDGNLKEIAVGHETMKL